MLQVSLIGYLGRDAILRHSQSGDFLSMSVGADLPDGSTVWCDCVWNGSHEKLAPFLTRGQQVYIQGNVSTGVYTDGNNQTRAYVKVKVFTIQLCGKRADSAPMANPAQGAQMYGGSFATQLNQSNAPQLQNSNPYDPPF